MSNKSERRRLRVKALKSEFDREYDGAETFNLKAQDEITILDKYAKPVNTGVCLQVPKHHIGFVTITDEFAKQGILLANGVHTINYDNQKEVKLSLISSKGNRTIFKGSKIAKVIVIPLRPVTPQYVKKLKGSEEDE